jgi:hypothetical protein
MRWTDIIQILLFWMSGYFIGRAHMRHILTRSSIPEPKEGEHDSTT